MKIVRYANRSGIVVANIWGRQYPAQREGQSAKLSHYDAPRAWLDGGSTTSAARAPDWTLRGREVKTDMNEVQIRAATDRWVAEFEMALRTADANGMRSLLSEPAYLRDNGALTWDYRQFWGSDEVASTLLALAPEIEPSGFRLSTNMPEPHIVGQGKDAYVEAFYDFDTRHGRGILLLNAEIFGSDAVPTLKARAIFTRLEDLSTIPAVTRHPRGAGYTPRVPGETWLQNRNAA